MGISKRSMSIMDSMMQDIFDRICRESQSLNRFGKSKTLSSKDIQSAVKLLVPGELAKHAVSEGTKAVSKYANKLSH